MNDEQLWQTLIPALDAAVRAAGAGSAATAGFPDTELQTFQWTLAGQLPTWRIVLGGRMVTAIHQDPNVSYIAKLIAIDDGTHIFYLLGDVDRIDQPSATL